MGDDLGTYYVKIELIDGRGYVVPVSTGQRLLPRETQQGWRTVPLAYVRQAPRYKSEQDLIDSQIFMHLEGNYACDCNKRVFLDGTPEQFVAGDEEGDSTCGDELVTTRITLIRPSGEEVVIWEHREEWQDGMRWRRKDTYA